MTYFQNKVVEQNSSACENEPAQRAWAKTLLKPQKQIYGVKWLEKATILEVRGVGIVFHLTAKEARDRCRKTEKPCRKSESVIQQRGKYWLSIPGWRLVSSRGETTAAKVLWKRLLKFRFYRTGVTVLTRGEPSNRISAISDIESLP